jgi:DNA-binding CsgD family transcriptional regulator
VVVDHAREWRSSTHIGKHLDDTSIDGMWMMRVVMCDGPELLGWLGCFREKAWESREKSELASLVLPLSAELRRGIVGRVCLAFETLSVPVFHLSATGRVLYANPPGSVLASREDRGLLEELAKLTQTPSASFDVTQLGDDRDVSYLAVARAASEHALDARSIAAASRWGFTKRQVEVLRRLVRGDSNKDIATKLECTVGTVELHITSILRRAGAVSRAQIVAKFWTE